MVFGIYYLLMFGYLYSDKGRARFYATWVIQHSFGFYDPGYSGAAYVGVPVLGPMEAEAELLQIFQRLGLGDD